MGSYYDGHQSGPFAGGDGTLGGFRAPRGRPDGRRVSWACSRPSFADFLGSLLTRPAARPAAPGLGADGGPPGRSVTCRTPRRSSPRSATHGVVLAGDRRATAGSMIAKRDVEKVFRSDEFSAMGYAGTGSVGIEFVRLFQVELEHYEKMEGRSLSLEGKANRLAWMVRGNLGRGHAGTRRRARSSSATTRSRDRAGSSATTWPAARTRSTRFHSIGSGSIFARGALKKLYADDMSVADAVLACVQALYDAADDDSATGGPDLTRRIFPVDRHGHRRRLPAAVRGRVRPTTPSRSSRAG